MSEFYKKHRKHILLVPLVILSVLLVYIIAEQSVFFAHSGQVDSFVRNYYKQVETVDSKYDEDTAAQHEEKVKKLVPFLSEGKISRNEYDKLIAMPVETKKNGGKLLSYAINNIRFGALRKNPFKDYVDVTVFFSTEVKYKKIATVFDGTAFIEGEDDFANVYNQGENSVSINFYKVSMRVKKINGEYKIIAFTRCDSSDKELE